MKCVRFLLPTLLLFGVFTGLAAVAQSDPGDACGDTPQIPPGYPANGCATTGLTSYVTPSTAKPFTDSCDPNTAPATRPGSTGGRICGRTGKPSAATASTGATAEVDLAAFTHTIREPGT